MISIASTIVFSYSYSHSTYRSITNITCNPLLKSSDTHDTIICSSEPECFCDYHNSLVLFLVDVWPPIADHNRLAALLARQTLSLLPLKTGVPDHRLWLITISLSPNSSAIGCHALSFAVAICVPIIRNGRRPCSCMMHGSSYIYHRYITTAATIHHHHLYWC